MRYARVAVPGAAILAGAASRRDATSRSAATRRSTRTRSPSSARLADVSRRRDHPYTGGWEVPVYATSREQAVRLAETIRPLNAPGEPGDPLPPPALDVARELGCEHR